MNKEPQIKRIQELNKTIILLLEENQKAKEGIKNGLIKEIKRVFKKVKNPYSDFIGNKGEREKNAFEQARELLLKVVLKIFK